MIDQKSVSELKEASPTDASYELEQEMLDHTMETEKLSFIAGVLKFRRGPWEMIASILIALGVVMLMQPVWLTLYTYSFLVTLIGTVMFIIVSHFPE